MTCRSEFKPKQGPLKVHDFKFCCHDILIHHTPSIEHKQMINYCNFPKKCLSGFRCTRAFNPEESPGLRCQRQSVSCNSENSMWILICSSFFLPLRVFPHTSGCSPACRHFDTLTSAQPTHPWTLNTRLNSAVQQECIPRTLAFRLSLHLVLAEQGPR